jgi:hypothetical protein
MHPPDELACIVFAPAPTALPLGFSPEDNSLRDLFMMLLREEEDHVDWLEAQMHLINKLGFEHYLIVQMGEDEEEIAVCDNVHWRLSSVSGQAYLGH